MADLTALVEDDVLSRLRDAFAGKLYLTRAELAPVLRMTVKTLGRCEEAGEISSRRKGAGKKRPRRVYAFEDVVNATFLQKQKGIIYFTPLTRARELSTLRG